MVDASKPPSRRARPPANMKQLSCDGDANRYGGRGTLRAVENVRRLIGPKIVGLDPTCQTEIDGRLITLDGMEDKSKIGTNAILGVSWQLREPVRGLLLVSHSIHIWEAMERVALPYQ